jgi:hypothetical protein
VDHFHSRDDGRCPKQCGRIDFQIALSVAAAIEEFIAGAPIRNTENPNFMPNILSFGTYQSVNAFRLGNAPLQS